MHCEYLSSNLNSCPEMLCKGTGQTEKTRAERALWPSTGTVLHMNYLFIELNNRFWLGCLGGTDKDTVCLKCRL